MKTSRKEMKSRARQCLKGHYGMLIGIYLALLLVAFAVFMGIAVVMVFNTLLVHHAGGEIGRMVDSPSFWIAYILIYLVMILFISVGSAGYLKIHLDLAQARPCRSVDIFYGFKHRPFRYIAFYLLYFLVAAVPMPFLFLVFLLVNRQFAGGGIIAVGNLIYWVFLMWLMLAYSQTMYILVEEPDMKLFTAMKTSRYMMKGNKWRMIVLGLSFIGWSFLCCLTCGLGYLWFIPYMMSTYTHFHLCLRTEQWEESWTKE